MATWMTAARPQHEDRLLVGGVATAFGVGEVWDVRRLANGLMNRNWQVVTPAGVFAVKQIIDIDRDRALRQHRATAALAAAGLHVPTPLRAPGGDTVVDHRGAMFAVLPWVAGAHREAVGLSVGDCGALGRLLAQLHAELAQVMPATPTAMTVPVAESGAAQDKIDRYLGVIDARGGHDEFDRHARTRLHERREMLGHFARLRPDAGAPVGPAGWTHGDFHDLNLLWDAGEVVAVLDWDRLDTRPLAAEVVRSATLMFGLGDDRGLDLDRVAAFAAGDRGLSRLADHQLLDAAHRLLWERVCDFWQLKWHYDRGDARVTTCSSRRRRCWPGGPTISTSSPMPSPAGERRLTD